MRDSSDGIALQARVADLEREVRALQPLVYGGNRAPYSESALQSLYWEACRRFGQLRPREVFLWTCLIRNLDVRQLLTLGRLVHDPFPWKPFLVLLDWATKDGFLVDDATAHILEVAQELMNAQGLWVLTPADIMGRPLAIQEALAEVTPRP